MDEDDEGADSADDDGVRENFCENQDRIPDVRSSGGTKFSRLEEGVGLVDLLR